MDIMDFMPQFKDNVQDVSGIPTNDAMAQLELQRRLKIAQQLQESKNPEGQMISGHYVAPSWTQYAANAMNKYYGGKKEAEAVKGYGDYQKTQQEKLAKAVETFGKEYGPEEIKTMKDNFVTQPLEMGANVPTSPFKTNDQVAQIYPNFNNQAPMQNMQGDTTVNQPIESTTYRPRTQTEKMQALYNFGKTTQNPELLNKMVLSQAESLFKTPESVLGKVDIDKFDPQSVNNFIASGSKDYSLLKPIAKDTAPIIKTMRVGTNEVTQQWDNDAKKWVEIAKGPAFKSEEAPKAPAGYVWGKPDANGNPTLTALTGGPADKSLNPNKEQSDAYTYSTRMESADKIINDLEGQYDPFKINIKTSGKTALIPGGQTAANKFLLSSKDQQVEQAERNFINAVLRRESGATIQPSEFESANQQYFSQPGDSPEVLAQKRQNRREAIDGLKRAAGPTANVPTTKKVVNFEDLK
jgi:hypothetical protein